MLKTRIIWFSIGAASASAAISFLVAKDLWAARAGQSSQLTEKFGDLETRIANLEKGLSENSKI